jgi:serine/threonine-protein kinase
MSALVHARELWTDGEPIEQQIGHYRLIRPLLRDGSLLIYEALDQRLDRTVAIKLRRPEAARQVACFERLQSEVRAINLLNHPGAIEIYDYGQTEHGTHYLIMRHLEGETLAQRIARGPLPLIDVLRFGAQLAATLAIAHHRGLVHRNIHPGDILIVDDLEVAGGRRVVLFNFDVVRLVGDTAQRRRRLTQPGERLGTPMYRPPEQWQDSAAATERADVYALGIVLFELLTGKPPFSGRAPKLMYKHMCMPLPLRRWATVIAEPMRALLQRMTTKQVDKRLSMRQVEARLRPLERRLLGALEQGSGRAEAPPQPTATPPPAGRVLSLAAEPTTSLPVAAPRAAAQAPGQMAEMAPPRAGSRAGGLPWLQILVGLGVLETLMHCWYLLSWTVGSTG